MKNLFYILFVVFSFAVANAEEDLENIVDKKQQETINEEQIFDAPEIMPKFSSEEYQDLGDFIKKNIRYPQYAVENGITGKVIVEFVVTKYGTIELIQEINSPHETLTQEVFRLLKLMPNWTPGMQDGKTVSVRYILPVKFYIPDNQEKKATKRKLKNNL
jgi:protein TonB